MGDGNYSGNGLILNTQSFTRSEIYILQQALGNTFNIHPSIHKNKGAEVIYIGAKDIDKIRETIRPHIHESQYYKIDRRLKTLLWYSVLPFNIFT